MKFVAIAGLLLLMDSPAASPASAATVLRDLPDGGSAELAQSPPQTENAALDLTSLRKQGIDSYRQGDYALALRTFRQVIAADPSDVVAYNVAGNSALRLKDYPAAVDLLNHALELRPDEYHCLSSLMRAYTLAEMTAKRDELRSHIEELAKGSKLPPTFSYVFDTFTAGDKRIEVAMFPQIQGFYGERYRFIAYDPGGKVVFCVTLESDQLEQPRWAKEHPKEAAAGGRRFSLDGYSREAHETYGFFDGEPAYDGVREEVKKVYAGAKKPISRTSFPSPQPIPGEN